MKHVRILFLVIAAMLFSQKAMAQCTFRNTAFKSGEFLTYNLYCLLYTSPSPRD